MGILPSASEIASAINALLPSYFVSCHHKGLYLSVGALVMAIEALICSLPHFLTDRYNIIDFSSNSTDLCLSKASASSVHSEAVVNGGHGQISLGHIFYMFLLA